MRTFEEILDTEAKREGWRALLEENAWLSDCPSDVDYQQWSDGRELAMTAHGAASWARWLEETTGREPAAEEIAALFRIPVDDIDALLDEVAGYVGPVSDNDLAHAIQAWAWSQSSGAEDHTVGEASAALEIPPATIARLVPELGDGEGGFFFRENTNRPLAEQTFGFDGE